MEMGTNHTRSVHIAVICGDFGKLQNLGGARSAEKISLARSAFVVSAITSFCSRDLTELIFRKTYADR